jgi:hypothetical protein
MKRKLIILVAAIGLAAFAAPSLASAAPALTMPANTLVPVGTELISRSNNFTARSSLGLFLCEEMTFNWELTKNNGEGLSGVGIGTGTTSGCGLEGGSEITVTDLTLQSIESTASGKGKLHFTVISDLPGVTCHYVTPAAGLTFTYGAESDSFTIPFQKMEASPAACRPGEIHATFTIETAAGGAATLD